MKLQKGVISIQPKKEKKKEGDDEESTNTDGEGSSNEGGPGMQVVRALRACGSSGTKWHQARITRGWQRWQRQAVAMDRPLDSKRRHGDGWSCLVASASDATLNDATTQLTRQRSS